MKLRPYQQEASDSVFKEWEDNRSTLVVLPTGCGKTQVFCDVIRRTLPRKSMILVHREELAFQAKIRLESFGIEAGIEMGKNHISELSWKQPDVVISTIQTQISGNDGEGRMLKFKPGDFQNLIIDEAHHATAETWVRCIDFYKLNQDLKVLGVTATPDRADEEALGRIFDTVAFDYEIMNAIQDGWLVPIHQQMVTIDSLDFSAMRTTAGDLNSGDLAELMELEKNLHGVVSSTLDIIGSRRTLVFAVTVRQAEMYSQIFNRHRIGMADWVCGATPKEERREKLRQFDRGEIQIMVNVGVLTEGYDSPGVEVIAMARPTKSRALYSQTVGRSTRPLPGLVDQFELAEERVAAIAASAKPNCLVIDFVGNAGRHKLMTTADILGGNIDDETIARANRRAAEEGEAVDMTELLAEEEEKMRLEAEERRQKEAAQKANLKGKAKFSIRTIDPFKTFQVDQNFGRGWDKDKKLSTKQVDFLLKQGIDPTSMTYTQGKQMVEHLFFRFKNKLATLKQCNLLQKHGYETKTLKMTEAGQLIDALAKNGWRRPAPPVVSGFPATRSQSTPAIPQQNTSSLEAFESESREIRQSTQHAEGELPF